LADNSAFEQIPPTPETLHRVPVKPFEVEEWDWTGEDFSHLLPSHQRIAAQENQERVEWIRHDRWINRTRLRDAPFCC
jgi:hypothetical protein